LEEPACKSFKTWGFSDASFWPVMKAELGNDYDAFPLPFDHDYNPKPAYFGMRDVLLELLSN